MNAHGLSRTIPEPVMREVRQRCGFGCVICGCAIVQYHHFSPEFADAREHRLEGITLLCGTCHDRASKGIVGTEQIEDFDSAPMCKRVGFTRDFLFASRDKVHFQIGSATFRRRAIIAYDNELLVGFAPPVSENGPLRLFARFEDDKGAPLLEIVDNVWSVGIHHFDVETFGNALVVRRRLGEITLKMLLNAGGEIVLERLQMGYRGFRVTVETGHFIVRNPNGGQLTLICPNIDSTLRLFSNGSAAV